MKILLALLLLFSTTAWANGDHDDDKPKPTPTTSSLAAPESHKREAFWSGAAAGGLAITALQKTEHPWFYTVAGGIALAGLARAADKVDSDEFKHAAAGIVAGATGVGLVFGNKFFGWQTAIKF
jgi:hypothetical protein